MYDSPRIFRLFSKSSSKNILRRSFAPENLALYKESCCGRTSHVILKWLKKTFERRKLAYCKFIIVPFIHEDNVILAIVILIENYLVHF